MFQTEHLQEKWQPVLEHPDLPKIEDSYRRAVTTIILENQEKSIKVDKNHCPGMGGHPISRMDTILRQN